MPQHYSPLLVTLTLGLGLAFILGTVANRLRLPPQVGYLMAGVVVGPFTPGFVADQALAAELAEIGVILLMFGVGLHFSLRDLLSVKTIAVPGALIQMVIATVLGMGLAWLLGWSLGAGFVFGLAVSVASTVVLIRALQKHRLMETERGRVALGWLVVQDMAIVVAIVLTPVLTNLLNIADSAGASGTASVFNLREVATVAGLQLGKVFAFVALMLIVGRRVIPWILHYIAHTGSRELFRLAVLSIALGVAFGAATLFDISLALGAFFAGMMLQESPLSQRAAEESLPLRDAFAVLFFVSVGMLFDPGILLRDPWPLAGTLIIIMICSPLAAYWIIRTSGRQFTTALTVAVSLAQIGEFSFILAGLGIELKVLPPQGRDLILAGALLSIFANPLLFAAIAGFKPKLTRPKAAKPVPAPAPQEDAGEQPVTKLKDHAIIVGYGRVGSAVGDELQKHGIPFVVIDDRRLVAEEARNRGVELIFGNAAQVGILTAANLDAARWLFVAIPDAFEAGEVVETARKENPRLEIIARSHSDAETDYLTGLGANLTIMGERELARGMLDHALGGARTRPAAGSA